MITDYILETQGCYNILYFFFCTHKYISQDRKNEKVFWIMQNNITKQ